MSRSRVHRRLKPPRGGKNILGNVALSPPAEAGGYGRYMEIRWLGEVELTFNPSFYPSLVRMPMAPMAGRPPTIAQSGWI